MAPTTPLGTRCTNTRFAASTDGGMIPSIRVESAAAMSKYAISSSTSSCASARSGFPWSSVSVRARSSRRRSTSSAIRFMTAARSNADRRAHPSQARLAPAMARRASSLVPSGTDAMTSPVAGLVASKTAPLSEATHWPSMNMLRSSATTPSPPGLEGPLVDLLVRLHVELPRIAHRLRILEGDLRQHGHLVLGEPELLERRDVQVPGELVDLLDGEVRLRRLRFRLLAHGLGDPGEPVGRAGHVELHDRAEEPACEVAVRDVVHASGRLAHGVRRPRRIG